MLTKEEFNRGKNEISKTKTVCETMPGKIGGKQDPYFANFLVLLLTVGSFFLGMFWTKANLLEKSSAVDNLVPTNVPVKVGDNNNAAPPETTADQIEKLTEGDHVRGNRNAEILLIEYSDTECPFSKRFHPTAKQVAEEFKDKVAWVYRHFPLDQIHSKTRKEAEATECAAKLAGNDGFWKLVNKIYEVTPSNNGLDLTILPKLASEVGLNQNDFKKCLDSGEMAQKVEANYQSGIKVGIQGTPGVVLLNTKTNKVSIIPGAVPFEQIKASINALLI